jgi:hypothetical protein
MQVTDDYDDPGFSGGTAERPALMRLLDDTQKGLIVVVYKIPASFFTNKQPAVSHRFRTTLLRHHGKRLGRLGARIPDARRARPL